MKRMIEKVIEEYNRYRSPEAVARVISIDERSFKIEFRGSFCRTCGFYDYIEDFKFMLEDKGIKAEIKEIKEIEGGVVVRFVFAK